MTSSNSFESFPAPQAGMGYTEDASYDFDPSLMDTLPFETGNSLVGAPFLDDFSSYTNLGPDEQARDMVYAETSGADQMSYMAPNFADINYGHPSLDEPAPQAPTQPDVWSSYSIDPMLSDLSAAPQSQYPDFDNFSTGPYGATTGYSFNTESHPDADMFVPSAQIDTRRSRSRSPLAPTTNFDHQRRVSRYRAEKPKKDNEHDWVRVNGSTKGLSSRTGKINAYNPKVEGGYQANRHPIGSWTGQVTNRAFDYTSNGELYHRVFTAEEITDFLFSHAKNGPKSNLTIWIQKTPADCARRYPTRGSDKCLFAECPFKHENRNILVGHMRVAFDEQWGFSEDRRDPFHVAAYAHLYCLERFCDLPRIAHHLNVKADNRVLPREPRGLWAATLGENTLYETAADFIGLCKSSRLNEQWPEYPYIQARGHPTDRPQPFEATLTYALTDAKLKETNNSKRAMMARRGLTPTNILVHKGDLQKLIDSKQRDKKRKRSLQNNKHYQSVKRQLDVMEGIEATRSDDEAPMAPRQLTKRNAAGAAMERVRRLSDEKLVNDGSDADGDFEPEERLTKRKRASDYAAPTAQMTYAPPPIILPSQRQDGEVAFRAEDYFA